MWLIGSSPPYTGASGYIWNLNSLWTALAFLTFPKSLGSTLPKQSDVVRNCSYNVSLVLIAYLLCLAFSSLLLSAMFWRFFQEPFSVVILKMYFYRRYFFNLFFFFFFFVSVKSYTVFGGMASVLIIQESVNQFVCVVKGSSR